MRTRIHIAWMFAVVALGASQDAFAQSSETAQQEAPLIQRAKAFVEAFHRGDAKALVAFWPPDGDYTDQTGRCLTGREAIESAFAGLFAENKGLKLRIDVASIRFVTPDVAVEDGTTAVIHPNGFPPSRARYTIVHVRRDGEWWLQSVREATYAPPRNYEHLRSLEWLIGDWKGATDDGPVARVSFAWTDNQNYINGSFATMIENIVMSSGEKWIGWDSAARRIRSWTFDADGGFAEGTWTPDGDTLVIHAKAVLRDGVKLSATNIITRVDANTISFQSKERTLDGESLPDVTEAKLMRAVETGS